MTTSYLVGNSPIDWNCNGTNSEPSVSTDINQDTLKTTLVSYNDWPNLVYKGGSVGGLGLFVTPPAQTAAQAELSPALDATILTPTKVTIQGAGTAQALAGSVVNFAFTVT